MEWSISKRSLIAECKRTDDLLWRPTRRAKGHYTKDKLSTRRGAVHSIGWLFSGPDRRFTAASPSQIHHNPSDWPSQRNCCSRFAEPYKDSRSERRKDAGGKSVNCPKLLLPGLKQGMMPAHRTQVCLPLPSTSRTQWGVRMSHPASETRHPRRDRAPLALRYRTTLRADRRRVQAVRIVVAGFRPSPSCCR